jgi:hypothetical protein
VERAAVDLPLEGAPDRLHFSAGLLNRARGGTSIPGALEPAAQSLDAGIQFQLSLVQVHRS